MMAIVQALLPFAAVGGVLLLLIDSISRERKAIAAERSLLNLLRSDPNSQRLRRVRERMAQEGIATLGDLQPLIEPLESLTRTLPVEQQRWIEEGLLQSSARGRARYAERLMDKAGLGSELMPIQVR